MALLKKARGALIVIGILTALGTVTLALRLTLRGHGGGVPTGDTVWNLKCQVTLNAKENAVLRIAIPADTSNVRVFGHDFTTPGLRQQRTRGQSGITRDFTAVAYREGQVSAEADFDLHLSTRPGWRPMNDDRELSKEALMKLIQPEPRIQSEDAVVADTLRKLRESRPANQRALRQLIFDYCAQQITLDDNSEYENAVPTLKNREGTSLGRARAMVALCRKGRIHARLVVGFVMDERIAPEPHVWLETLFEKRWEQFDPEFGHAGKLPANFLPMRRGGSEIIRATNAEIDNVDYVLKRVPVPRGMLATDDRSPLQILDMTRLPLVTQLSLTTLLLLPLGALLTTFFRNVVGVRTFGTFSPTLLALAAVYADWRTVSMIFVLVIIFGVGGRALLPGFKLMQVPRLSIVFTLVAVSMMLSVSLLDYFGLNPTGQIALLPMVVLTSLVDRIYSVADDDGMRVAAVRLMWTAGVGVLCFGLFLWKGFGHILLEFPELHFYTISSMLLFGLYAGKKLCDLPAFAFLGEPKAQKPKEKEEEAKAATATLGEQAATEPASVAERTPAATPPGDVNAEMTSTESTTDRETPPNAPQST